MTSLKERRAKHTAYMREWIKNNPKWQKQHYEKVQRWRKKNQIKSNAHAAVSRAVKRGVLTRPENCDNCFVKSLVHAHHDDYSRPLWVKWLCSRCHANLHHGEAK